MRKYIILILAMVALLSLVSCGKENSVKVPKDFYFSLTWGINGQSSYDSETGKLVKTTHTRERDPNDYITYYRLTKADKEYFYGLIEELDIYSYPDEYDPENAKSEPSKTIILQVRIGSNVKTITAAHVGITEIYYSEKGMKFLDTCHAIATRLTWTKEWKALPDYEVYFF